MTETPLHGDEPDAEFTHPDGTVVRNLTPAQYAATYAEGTPHAEGPDTETEPDLAGELED